MHESSSSRVVRTSSNPSSFSISDNNKQLYSNNGDPQMSNFSDSVRLNKL